MADIGVVQRQVTQFRFIHTSDFHLGKRFSTYPESIRGRLVEARHSAIGSLARAAKNHDACDIFVAGDLFDTETPTQQVWRQALAAMEAAQGIRWWIIPGNHDSLAAEVLWKRFGEVAPKNVRLLVKQEAIEVCPGVSLLPSPLTHRFPGKDLTEWMSNSETPKGNLRIGLVHGSVVNFGSEDNNRETIPIERAKQARLDYLALGDWHGFVEVTDRAFYSGSPERDRFKHQGKGICLAVTIDGSGAPPHIEKVEIGKFDWFDEKLRLAPEQDVRDALATVLPESGVIRRDTLVRVKVSGWATLPQRMVLQSESEQVKPEFAFFELDDTQLSTECDVEDLDEIATDGALRVAARQLFDEARIEGANARDQRIADAALRRLHSLVRDCDQ